MKSYFAVVLVAVAFVVGGSVAHAEDVIHYACHRGHDRYALTVHEDSIKLLEQGPPHDLTTFRIVKADEECGKGGWLLSNQARFCYATRTRVARASHAPQRDQQNQQSITRGCGH